MRGSYTIILRCMRPLNATFGKLGHAKLDRGYYVYTGSALGRGSASLENRLRRHMRHRKRLKWHIDYLTTKNGCNIAAVVFLQSERRLECSINRHIRETFLFIPILPGLGSSDCKCDAHLRKANSGLTMNQILDRVERIHAEYGKPICLRVLDL